MRATLLALLICGFSVIAVPHSAAASTTQTVNFSGQGGYADFQSFSGCVETDTYVYAAQTMSHGNTGGPPPGPGVSVNIFQYDNCAQTPLVAAFGFASPTTLQMDRKLSNGAVTASVPMQDYVSNNTFTVSVNVSWTGSGPVSRSVFTSHFKGPGYSGTNHFQGTFRDATATGSVNDGTTEWAASPAAYAQLFSSNQGYVQITTY